MALMADTRKENKNVATQDNLIRKVNTIEDMVIDWMEVLAELHASVDDGDKSEVLALRASLISKLTAAVSIS